MEAKSVVRWKLLSSMNCQARQFVRIFSCLSFVMAAGLLTGCCRWAYREGAVQPQAINFEAGDVGKLPADFTTALTGGGGPISWVVREDAQAPGGGPVLVQESSDDTSYRFPMCIYDKVRARDVAVEVKAYKVLSGKVDEAGGIVLRYNPENFYIARANVLEDNVDLFKTVKGKRSLVEEVPVKVSGGVWHTLRFEAKGPRLTIDFDGATMIETNDTTFSGPGQVGLWTGQGRQCIGVHRP